MVIGSSRRGRGRGVALLLAFGLVGAACGDDSTGSDSTVADNGDATATTSADEPRTPDADDGVATVDDDEAVEAETVSDVVFRYGSNMIGGSGVPYFDPVLADGNQPSRMWMDLIYDTIIRKTPDGGEAPGLAESWDAPDDRTLVLNFREGVLFHDGTPLDAEAVKFSFDRVLADPPANLPPDLRAINSVEILDADDIIIQLTLDEPVVGSLIRTWLKSSYTFAVVSPTAVELHGDDYNSNPVGAGPYRFVSYEEDQRVTLERFDDYWDPADQRLGGFQIIQTDSGAPMVAKLLAGEIDMGPLSSTDLPGVEQADGLEIVTQLSDATLMPVFCTSQPPFDDVRARQAFAHAIDREAIAQAAFGPEGAVTDQPLATTSPYYDESSSGTYPYDPERSRELLAEAGVAEGTTVQMLVLPVPGVVRAAEVMQAQLAQIGIDLQIELAQSYVADLFEMSPEIALPAPVRVEAHGNFLAPGGPVNWCDYDNPELGDALFRTKSADDDVVAEAWAEAQRQYTEDLPAIFIANDPLIEAHSTAFAGVTRLFPQTQGPLLRTIYAVED
jgi:ABC-type transport system substrate-binding protein